MTVTTNTDPKAPQRAYLIGTLGSMAVYVAAIMALSYARNGNLLSGPALYAAALVPGLAIGWQMVVTLRLMARSDEFMRALMAKRFIVAAAISFMFCTTWGFLETYADLPHLPGYVSYMAFWAAFGAISPFIRSSR